MYIIRCGLFVHDDAVASTLLLAQLHRHEEILRVTRHTKMGLILRSMMHIYIYIKGNAMGYSTSFFMRRPFFAPIVRCRQGLWGFHGLYEPIYIYIYI